MVEANLRVVKRVAPPDDATPLLHVQDVRRALQQMGLFQTFTCDIDIINCNCLVAWLEAKDTFNNIIQLYKAKLLCTPNIYSGALCAAKYIFCYHEIFPDEHCNIELMKVESKKNIARKYWKLGVIPFSLAKQRTAGVPPPLSPNDCVVIRRLVAVITDYWGGYSSCHTHAPTLSKAPTGHSVVTQFAKCHMSSMSRVRCYQAPCLCHTLV